MFPKFFILFQNCCAFKHLFLFLNYFAKIKIWRGFHIFCSLRLELENPNESCFVPFSKIIRLSKSSRHKRHISNPTSNPARKSQIPQREIERDKKRAPITFFSKSNKHNHAKNCNFQGEPAASAPENRNECLNHFLLCINNRPGLSPAFVLLG